jgi:hypothetical protein
MIGVPGATSPSIAISALSPSAVSTKGARRCINIRLGRRLASLRWRIRHAWSIESRSDARQIFGTGQHNRTARAVERTIPFQLACQAIAMAWYATAGHDPADIHTCRVLVPWYGCWPFALQADQRSGTLPSDPQIVQSVTAEQNSAGCIPL